MMAHKDIFSQKEKSSFYLPSLQVLLVLEWQYSLLMFCIHFLILII